MATAAGCTDVLERAGEAAGAFYGHMAISTAFFGLAHQRSRYALGEVGVAWRQHRLTGRGPGSLSKGQQVMAVAMAYPLPEKGGKGKRSRI